MENGIPLIVSSTGALRKASSTWQVPDDIGDEGAKKQSRSHSQEAAGARIQTLICQTPKPVTFSYLRHGRHAQSACFLGSTEPRLPVTFGHDLEDPSALKLLPLGTGLGEDVQ